MTLIRSLELSDICLRITEDEGSIVELKLSHTPFEKSNGNSPLLLEAEKQLKGYFSGRIKQFDLPLNPEGTDFQKKTWNEACRIPYGRTLSYGELAEKCGSRKKARAVGNALGKNPIPVIIPCHRILAGGGKIGGFTGGLGLKRILLSVENIKISSEGFNG